jgi:hypothetical protein
MIGKRFIVLENCYYYLGDKMEEMGGACSEYVGEKRRIQSFGGET